MRVKERAVASSRQCEQHMLESGLPIFKVIDDAETSDPFLLLDHIGPVTFQPGEAVGAPDHPHRGIELISVLLQGSIHHADSIGHDSVLPSGTVQHIQFGRGFVHFEMPSDAMQQAGGVLEGYQVWVNLPQQHKMCSPIYKEFAPDEVPIVRTEDSAAEIRVIAGSCLGVDGIINCRTPIVLLDIRLRNGANISIDLPDQYQQAFAYCFNGKAAIGNSASELEQHHYAALTLGESVQLCANAGQCHILLAAGVPLRQPVVKFGPFAMANEQEIRNAVQDYRSGLMGECPPPGMEARQRSNEAAIAKQRANGKDV